MDLCNLNNIKQEREHLPFVFKMNGPGNESAVIWRRPGIRGKVETARVFLVEYN